MKLAQNDVEKINAYMQNKTRDLELAFFNILTGDDEIMASYALSMYQNRDGGFGKGLNPNSMDKNSSVYQTIFALDLIKKYFHDFKEEFLANMIRKSLAFLEKNLNNETFPFSSTLLDYPRAEWIDYEGIKEEYYIRSLEAFLFFQSPRTGAYKRALLEVKRVLAEPITANTINPLLNLYEVLPNEYKSEAYSIIQEALKNFIDLSESNWKTTNKLMPANILTKSFVSDYSAIYDKNLDFIISNRTFLGTWDLEYDFSNSNEEDSDVARIKWAGVITVHYFNILKENKRILVI